MGLINKLFGNKEAEIELQIDSEIQSKGFEISSCLSECESCTASFPKSMEKDIDGSSLWNSAKPYGLHIVIPTGKTDWIHDACSEKGKLPNAVSDWSNKNANEFPEIGDIKVNVSSLSASQAGLNEAYMNETRGDLLLLPFFIWIRNVSVDDVGSVLDQVIPDLIASRDNKQTPKLAYSDFPEVGIEIDKFQSYILLCSHRTRDKKCGITAPIMKKEIDLYLRDFGLIRDFGDDREGGVQVAFVNHIGGHKFAANVIIYLKKSGKNIWLARCKPNNVKPIIDECILNNGKVWPEKIRIIQKFNPIDW